jgi:hypothetical protein
MPSTINFDASTVAPQTGFEPVPNGTYRAMIVESEVKPTKDSNGQYLQLTWQILEGECKGRKIWDRLNIQNPSSEAQRIGQAQLSAVCHATGVLKLTTSQQLHNIPCDVKTVVKESKGYEPKNEIKSYKSVPGSSAPAATPSASTSAAAPAAVAPAWAQPNKKAS